MDISTADLCDAHADELQIAEPGLVTMGGAPAFGGPIATVQVLEDNVLVRQALEEPGLGRVLVIDGGGSLRCALLGDMLATLARDNGWAGVIVNGWKDKAERVVKAGDWNEYSIFCKGGDVRIKVNGMVTAELSGETPKEGVIALQLHAGTPMKVEFRNLRIKKLD